MAFKNSVWPRKEEGEEEGGSVFHANFSHRGFHEETAPGGTKGLFSKWPEPSHVGQEQLHSGQLEMWTVLVIM